MTNTKFGIKGYGSVELDSEELARYDGESCLTIRAVTPRLMSMVSDRQETTYYADKARELREMIERTVKNRLGFPVAGFWWD